MFLKGNGSCVELDTLCVSVCGCVCLVCAAAGVTQNFRKSNKLSRMRTERGGGARKHEKHTHSAGGGQGPPLATHSPVRSVETPASQLAHARARPTHCAARAHQRAQGGVLINWLLGDLVTLVFEERRRDRRKAR